MERGLIKTSAGYIHYRAAGHGKVIVLSHISQQSSAMYLELMARHATEVRAVSIYFPSVGMCDHVAVQPTIADYAQCGREGMDAMGIDQAHVLGEALGAAVSIELAAETPARVNKVVLVNCPWYS